MKKWESEFVYELEHPHNMPEDGHNYMITAIVQRYSHTFHAEDEAQAMEMLRQRVNELDRHFMSGVEPGNPISFCLHKLDGINSRPIYARCVGLETSVGLAGTENLYYTCGAPVVTYGRIQTDVSHLSNWHPEVCVKVFKARRHRVYRWKKRQSNRIGRIQ